MSLFPPLQSIMTFPLRLFFSLSLSLLSLYIDITYICMSQVKREIIHPNKSTVCTHSLVRADNNSQKAYIKQVIYYSFALRKSPSIQFNYARLLLKKGRILGF